MAENERERELLRELLAEQHRSTHRRAPEFDTLWSRAADEMRASRTGRRRGLTLAAAAAVVLALAVTTILWRPGRHDPRDIERAMTVATTFSEWQAPLDFLLETPGREWLESTPEWPVESAAGHSLPTPDHLAPDFAKEVRQ